MATEPHADSPSISFAGSPAAHASETPSPATTNPLRFANPADIDEFVSGLRSYESGAMTADQFRVFRLARGTYGQRQMDVSMLRIKIPLGVVSSPQIEMLASVADTYSRGFGHITTRQNVQMHFIKLDRVPAMMRELETVGLTTKEACGNTVRTITGCAMAGICNDAPFDITPYGQAATRYFLRNPICQSLPRKFKVAFSGCEDDCAQGAINDIGLIARTRVVVGGEGKGTNVERGFRVRVAGGLSTSPENGHVLFDFLPEDELLGVLEAVVRVFDRMGNRNNKSRARLKYVVRKIGWDGFLAEFETELALVREGGRGLQHIDSDEPTIPVSALRPRASRPAIAPREGFSAWRATNVLPQKQAGLFAAIVRLVRGDITSAQLRVLARLATEYADGTARFSNEQNAILRSIPEAELAAVHATLVDAGLGLANARTISDVTACPGADTCNLAVTHSRELALALSDKLENANGSTSAVAAAKHLDIKISGCPNSCGQHHIAAIGFHGTMRRVGGKAVPEYQVHLGGGIDAATGATFGRQVVKVPARRVPDAVLRLLELYMAQRTPGEEALAFFRRVDESAVKEAVADLSRMDEETAKPEDFIDLGQDSQFVVAIGQGECAT